MDHNDGTRFVAIAVLIVGVAGGLCMVFCIMVLCKNCFRRWQPLPHHMRGSNLKRYHPTIKQKEYVPPIEEQVEFCTQQPALPPLEQPQLIVHEEYVETENEEKSILHSRKYDEYRPPLQMQRAVQSRMKSFENAPSTSREHRHASRVFSNQERAWKPNYMRTYQSYDESEESGLLEEPEAQIYGYQTTPELGRDRMYEWRMAMDLRQISFHNEFSQGYSDYQPKRDVVIRPQTQRALKPQIKARSLQQEATLNAMMQVSAHQAHSIDCTACRVSPVQQYRPQQQTQSPEVTRARQREELEQECQNLWTLRSILETDSESMTPEPESSIQPVEVSEPSQQEPGAEPSVGGSFTTSMESNTEPFNWEDSKNRQQRSSATFLELPKLSLEAKRQKYRGLLACRHMDNKEESMESWATYSSESGIQPPPPPALEKLQNPILSKFSVESNNTESSDSQTKRTKMGDLKNDSGYKSQSTEATQTVIMSKDKITQMPSIQSDENELSGSGGQQSFSKSTDSKSDELTSGHQMDNRGEIVTDREHLAYLYRSSDAKTQRPELSRDFSVDKTADNLFKEFVRYDPKLPKSKNRPKPRMPLSSKCALKQAAVIPIIKLPDDQEAAGSSS